MNPKIKQQKNEGKKMKMKNFKTIRVNRRLSFNAALQIAYGVIGGCCNDAPWRWLLELCCNPPVFTPWSVSLTPCYVSTSRHRLVGFNGRVILEIDALRVQYNVAALIPRNRSGVTLSLSLSLSLAWKFIFINAFNSPPDELSHFPAYK